MGAFNLANGVSKVQTRGADDYITHDEFRLLMVATSAALVIYRLFDIADESDDRRVEQHEWDKQLTDFGYSGDPIVSEDFSSIDTDGGGMILLNEAVVFFLDKFTSETALLQENIEEGSGKFSKQPSMKKAPSMKKQPSVKEERRRSVENVHDAFEKHTISGAGGGVAHFGDHHAHAGEMRHTPAMTEDGGRMKFPKSEAPDASYDQPGAFDGLKNTPHA